MTVTVENKEIEIKDQTQEYAERGDNLENTNYLDFFLEMYDHDHIIRPSVGPAISTVNHSKRSPYRPNCGRDDKCHVFHQAGHETLPEFIGCWFPRRDMEGFEDVFAAWMLTMLKPWREISDIASGYTDRCLYDTFIKFERLTSSRNQNVIKNIQYYYECWDSADKRMNDPSNDHLVTFEEHKGEGIVEDVVISPVQYTERDLECALQPKMRKDEELYTKVGMLIAEEARFFVEDVKKKAAFCHPEIASVENIEHYMALEEAVKNIKKQKSADAIHNMTMPTENVHSISSFHNVPNPSVLLTSSNLPASDGYITDLNTEQRRAHDIVAASLKAHLEGRRTGQILMVVIGAGGTGKSALLNAITKTLESRNAHHLLAKMALSGVAATVVGGTTLHWWGGLPTRISGSSNDWMDRKSTTKDLKARRECCGSRSMRSA